LRSSSARSGFLAGQLIAQIQPIRSLATNPDREPPKHENRRSGRHSRRVIGCSFVVDRDAAPAEAGARRATPACRVSGRSARRHRSERLRARACHQRFCARPCARTRCCARQIPEQYRAQGQEDFSDEAWPFRLSVRGIIEPHPTASGIGPMLANVGHADLASLAMALAASEFP
jgi:hypothetical protein